MGDHVNARFILSNITSMYCDIGEYDKALYYLQKQLVSAQKTDNKNALRGCYIDYAEVYVNQKKYNDALDKLLESKKLDREVGDSMYAYAVYFTRCSV
ncbi:MAG: tetratricopeptide repeat protein [Ignavibacteria bacterium]|nr:tetratricopeptide repeat protein [Ignavibacteria bacterium]